MTPTFHYRDEPVFVRPAPAPRRQPEPVVAPKPRAEVEPAQRVRLPGPDALGITLTEPLDLPPPEKLGIEVQ